MRNFSSHSRQIGAAPATRSFLETLGPWPHMVQRRMVVSVVVVTELSCCPELPEGGPDGSGSGYAVELSFDGTQRSAAADAQTRRLGGEGMRGSLEEFPLLFSRWSAGRAADDRPPPPTSANQSLTLQCRVRPSDGSTRYPEVRGELTDRR